jgi:urea carboxylase
MEPMSPAIVKRLPGDAHRPKVVYRLAGDSYLLVEYGEIILDLHLRFRIHSLERAIHELGEPGVIETAPGVRSLLIRYDCLSLSLAELIELLRRLEDDLPAAEEMVVPSRLVHLPIACHDRWTIAAVKQYMESVRAEAPYVPDNMEFIARSNGLSGVDEVEAYVMATEHLVIGLGDVYLGAPCAVPLDPRRRLVVPKYNPARTWTPEGAVGIGGAYLCIYPMESPGGYQLFGRTLPIWNTTQSTPDFAEAPWLLRTFDRIQFESVSEGELESLREAMLQGDYKVRIEDGQFSVAEYTAFLDEVDEAAAVLRKQQAAAIAGATEGY